MASLCLSATVVGGVIISPSSTTPTTSKKLRCCHTIPNSVQPHGNPCFSKVGRLPGRSSHVVSMAPEEERMTRRSPLDFPIEWERPKPGRRPDIFPQFSPMKTPLPTPMPADPPEEDEDEEEKKEEEEEDPEKEEQDNPEQ